MINNCFESDTWLQEQLTLLAMRSKKSAEDLANVAGVSRATYYNRYNTPEDFSLKELRKLNNLAKRYNMSLYREDAG